MYRNIRMAAFSAWETIQAQKQWNYIFNTKTNKQKITIKLEFLPSESSFQKKREK